MPAWTGSQPWLSSPMCPERVALLVSAEAEDAHDERPHDAVELCERKRIGFARHVCDEAAQLRGTGRLIRRDA